MFLKNKSNIFKFRRSKVTDYAALIEGLGSWSLFYLCLSLSYYLVCVLQPFGQLMGEGSPECDVFLCFVTHIYHMTSPIGVK